MRFLLGVCRGKSAPRRLLGFWTFGFLERFSCRQEAQKLPKDSTPARSFGPDAEPARVIGSIVKEQQSNLTNKVADFHNYYWPRWGNACLRGDQLAKAFGGDE
jgi:hypothetical protein